MLLRFSHVKRQTEGVKETPKTNNSNLSAYIGTVRFELCSKSKHPAQQALLQSFSQKQRFLQAAFTQGRLLAALYKNYVLTVWGFFDTLKNGEAIAPPFVYPCLINLLYCPGGVFVISLNTLEKDLESLKPTIVAMLSIVKSVSVNR